MSQIATARKAIMINVLLKVSTIKPTTIRTLMGLSENFTCLVNFKMTDFIRSPDIQMRTVTEARIDLRIGVWRKKNPLWSSVMNRSTLIRSRSSMVDSLFNTCQTYSNMDGVLLSHLDGHCVNFTILQSK